MILSDTLYLEHLDVKLCPEITYTEHVGAKRRHAASLVLGENLSLSTIKANCQIDFNSSLPRLRTLIYSSGYRPSKNECDQIAFLCPNLEVLNCEKRVVLNDSEEIQ